MTYDPFNAGRDAPRDYVEDQWARADDVPTLWDFSGPTWFGLGMVAGFTLATALAAAIMGGWLS